VADGDLIRELPADERPRERLLAHGPESMGDAELIAVLLRTGRSGSSAISMAREILAGQGGIAGLAAPRPRALRIRGLGPAKRASILAAVEIGRRLARAEIGDREALARPAAVARYLALRFALREQELLGALYLDVRNRLVGERELYRGTLSRAAVEPRRILQEGLLLGAAGCIVFHNHPSGDPTPSAEDLAFTRRLSEAGELVGIRLVDHLVLGGPGRWLSLRERGGW
jgi:DNA repair protein RadC